MNKIIQIGVVLFVLGGTGYALYGAIQPSVVEKTSQKKVTATDHSKMDKMVTYVKPKVYSGTKSAITSYLGEIQTEKNGQIYPYRNGIVEVYLANVGDSVKKGQVVARLLPAEYSPDIANMIADRKVERTRSEGMVKSAELTLREARSRKESIIKASDMKIENANLIQTRVADSTANQLEKTSLEQDAKIAKLQSDLASMDVQISTQEKTIINMKMQTEASVALESDKLALRESTAKIALKNAHSTLIRIFYGTDIIPDSSYLPGTLRNAYFGAASTSATSEFVSTMRAIHPRLQRIDTLSQSEILLLLKDVSSAIDKGLKVLDTTIVSSGYSSAMLNMDKADIIELKTDSMNGVLTILNMYEEQKSMLAKETTVSSGEYTNEILMLERLGAERDVAEKELAMAKAEKDRMLAETRNMKSESENEASKMVTTENADKIMSLSEIDRMITEGEKMVIDARSSYQAAAEAL